MRQRTTLRGVVVLTLALMATAPASASIIAQFEGGLGNATPDQYVGTAGDGWSGAWSLGTTANFQQTVTVETANPLLGNGAYLQTALTQVATFDGSGNQSRLYHRRQYEATDAIALDGAHTVSWLFRMDSSDGFLNYDGFHFFDHTSFTSASGSSGTSWNISTRYPGLPIQVRNGTSNVSSPMNLVQGVVYEFIVDLDPANSQYVVTITNHDWQAGDPGMASWTSNTLAFWNGATTVGGRVHMGVGVDRAPLSGTHVTYSLDAVTIVPEPASLALLGLGALGLIRRRR